MDLSRELQKCMYDLVANDKSVTSSRVRLIPGRDFDVPRLFDVVEIPANTSFTIKHHDGIDVSFKQNKVTIIPHCAMPFARIVIHSDGGDRDVILYLLSTNERKKLMFFRFIRIAEGADGEALVIRRGIAELVSLQRHHGKEQGIEEAWHEKLDLNWQRHCSLSIFQLQHDYDKGCRNFNDPDAFNSLDERVYYLSSLDDSASGSNFAASHL